MEYWKKNLTDLSFSADFIRNSVQISELSDCDQGGNCLGFYGCAQSETESVSDRVSHPRVSNRFQTIQYKTNLKIKVKIVIYNLIYQISYQITY